jgi:cytochrome c biogenesis protein CcmG, thiol:disulfide interchange protein DsbE
VVLVAVLALLVWGMARKQGGFTGFAVNSVGQVGRVLPGPAPDFELRLFSVGAFRRSEQRGRPVVVNFWASWCPPCRQEAPVLERAWRRYHDRGVVVIGVDIWDSEQDARRFLRELGITYPNGPDPTGEIVVDYGLTGIPETVLVRPDGTMARRWVGPITDEQVTALIDELLPRRRAGPSCRQIPSPEQAALVGDARGCARFRIPRARPGKVAGAPATRRRTRRCRPTALDRA